MGALPPSAVLGGGLLQGCSIQRDFSRFVAWLDFGTAIKRGGEDLAVVWERQLRA